MCNLKLLMMGADVVARGMCPFPVNGGGRLDLTRHHSGRVIYCAAPGAVLSHRCPTDLTGFDKVLASAKFLKVYASVMEVLSSNSGLFEDLAYTAAFIIVHNIGKSDDPTPVSPAAWKRARILITSLTQFIEEGESEVAAVAEAVMCNLVDRSRGRFLTTEVLDRLMAAATQILSVGVACRCR